MENDTFTPEAMAENAQKAAETMHKTTSETVNAYGQSAKTAADRLFEMNTALMGMFQDNMQNYMRHMQHLAAAKSWPEFAEMQSQFLQQQMRLMSEQSDKMRNQFTAMMTESAKPLSENAEANAQRFRSYNS